MERYTRFREMGESIGQGDPTGKSTLAISTVIMPPRLTSFNTNRQAGGHVPWMNRTEDILELNRRIINRNKEKTIDADGRLVVPKFDVGVTPVWFQQAGVESYSKREVAAGRVITTRDPNGPMPLARGHVFSSWRESEPTRMLAPEGRSEIEDGSQLFELLQHLYKIGGPIHYTYYDMY